MESHRDIFVSDLKKRRSSEVTQFAKLFRVMKARVMTKKMQKVLSGTGW